MMALFVVIQRGRARVSSLRRVSAYSAGCLLLFRSTEFKELEIVVLRHELAVLRRHVRRPASRSADRWFLAAAARMLPKNRWSLLLVTPATVLRWHRHIVAKRWRVVIVLMSAQTPGPTVTVVLMGVSGCGK